MTRTIISWLVALFKYLIQFFVNRNVYFNAAELKTI